MTMIGRWHTVLNHPVQEKWVFDSLWRILQQLQHSKNIFIICKTNCRFNAK